MIKLQVTKSQWMTEVALIQSFKQGYHQKIGQVGDGGGWGGRTYRCGNRGAPVLLRETPGKTGQLKADKAFFKHEKYGNLRFFLFSFNL